jgi:UDP-3-O-[3-hydroxymyristoyl] glucosamine N-acyltransferase
MNIIQLTELINLDPQNLIYVSGPKSGLISGVSIPENIAKNTLVFISKDEHLQSCIKEKASVVIATKTLIQNEKVYPFTLFSVNNLKDSMRLVLPLFDSKLERFNFSIHSTAVISESAQLGKNCKIGPYSVIGNNVIIKDNVIIGPHCIIESDSKVGSSSILHGFVFLGSLCEIGSNCEIHPHTTVGSDGFGYTTDRNYQHHKIPQLGKVIIEDNVEIGANCCFDRATLSRTLIKKGTKIDNLCHVAHNCTIGENSLIAAGFFVAGSSALGDNFTSGGNSVVSTHIKICPNVTLAGRSTVTKDITEPGQYGGYPLQKLKDALKTISSIGKLVEMRKTISSIYKHLNLTEKIEETK